MIHPTYYKMGILLILKVTIGIMYIILVFEIKQHNWRWSICFEVVIFGKWIHNCTKYVPII